MYIPFPEWPSHYYQHHIHTVTNHRTFHHAIPHNQSPFRSRSSDVQNFPCTTCITRTHPSCSHSRTTYQGVASSTSIIHDCMINETHARTPKVPYTSYLCDSVHTCAASIPRGGM